VAQSFTLTVMQAPVTAYITASDKHFDGTTNAAITSCTIPAKIGTDDVACAVPPGDANFASANANVMAQTVTATGIILTGTTAGNYTLTSTTATTSALINPDQTSTVVTSSANPSQYGQAVMFTAMVLDASGTGVTPTGTVQFIVDGVNLGSPMMLAGGSTSSTSISTITVTGSPHIVTTNYKNTDGNFQDSSGSLAAGQAVTPAPLTITASSGSMTYGSISPVMVGPLFIGPSNFVNGEAPGVLSSPPSCTPLFTSATGVGTYTTACTGAADPNYTISYLPGSVMVTAATTNTVVSSSPNQSNWGNVVTLTATVTNTSPSSIAAPTGNVSFYVNPSGLCTSPGTAALDTEPLSMTGTNVYTASTSTPNLPIGTDNILACYNFNTTDNPNYNLNFTSTSGTLSQTVIPAPIATLTPASLSFGNQAGGTSSNAQAVTLCNGPSGAAGSPCFGAPVSTAVLEITSIGFTDPNTNPVYFTETNTCPIYPANTLAIGGSCIINAKFAPPANASGIATALVTATDNNENMSGSMQNSSVTGAGTSSINGVGSLSSFALFATANGCSSLTVSGNGTIDSYNGAVNNGNAGTNGNATLSGNPVVNGAVYSPDGGTGSCSSKTVTGLTTNGKAQATGGLKALAGTMNYPLPPLPSPVPPTTNQNIAGSCPSGMTGCTNNGSKNVSLAPGTYGNVSVSGGTIVQLSAGMYEVNSLTLTGNSTLQVNSGPVILSVAGASLNSSASAVDLSGGTMVNASGVSKNVQIYYAGSNAIKLSGGTQTYALVYAPNSPVNVSGGSHYYGAIVGNTINSSGNTAMHGDAALTAIGSGDYIWFNSAGLNVQGLPNTGSVKLYITNASISFSANGIVHNVFVPNAVITFSSTVTSPSTTWDAINNRWSTLVPMSSVSGNANVHTFFDGVAFPVPSGGFPGGIQNATWQAAFSTSTPGVKFNWQWGAAVYSMFPATGSTGNYTSLEVNPLDSSDPAGTPEVVKANLLFGDMGAGYTGLYLGTTAVVPTIAPMSISPSSYDFGTVATGTTYYPSAGTSFVVTNSDSVPYTISSITVTGTYAADFPLLPNGAPNTPNNCLAPMYSSLGPGASCIVYPSFNPKAPSGMKETAKVVVSDGAANSPQTIFLKGTVQ
jgi:hypothetical protein